MGDLVHYTRFVRENRRHLSIEIQFPESWLVRFPLIELLTLGKRQPESGDTRRPGVQLNRGKSKVLVSVMSEPFQVFSAKKFPGMIESTPLSKAFAGQGIRIPVRHGNNNETNGNANRGGHQASDTPPDADMEDEEDN